MSELLQERAYKLILDRIARGSLPPGARLSEPDLAEEIGISRTPVRDAVTQLQCEGLIERMPRYGHHTEP
jgi:GntR family transcriptional regulator of vanillate catabolism